MAVTDIVDHTSWATGENSYASSRAEQGFIRELAARKSDASEGLWHAGRCDDPWFRAGVSVLSRGWHRLTLRLRLCPLVRAEKDLLAEWKSE